MTQLSFTCWFNQLGWLAGTAPVALFAGGGCTVSVQVAGRRLDDTAVL